MKTWMIHVALPLAFLQLAGHHGLAEVPLNTWVKLSPLENTPPSPRLGYEGACAWDTAHQKLIRYGGHNQGGGGEQGSEIWIFDPANTQWELREPNTTPPGICCGQQNVFDPIRNRYIRFPSFSGSHGWQWFREIYLNDSSVWTYDPATNRWRNLRPLPAPLPRPLRGASWDTHQEVIVLFGGEGSHEGTWVYDPFANTWTEMNPSQEPEPRSGGNMVYAAASKRHVLFGSQFSDDPHTWTYDLTKNEWKTLDCEFQPPTDKNDAVLTYDPHADRVIALAKVTEGDDENARHRLETWCLDVAGSTWTRMNPMQEPDPSGNRARQLHFAPELNFAILENCPNPANGREREQQIWTYRLADEPARSPNESAPRNLTLVTSESSVTLTWDAQAQAAGTYQIERGEGTPPWSIEFERVSETDAAIGTWVDEDVVRGRIYHYRVGNQNDGSSGRFAKLGSRARSQPALVDGIWANVLSATEIEIRWELASATDIAGYEVERAGVDVLSNVQLKRISDQTAPLDEPSIGAISRIGAFQKIGTQSPTESSFTDRSVDLTKPESESPDGEPVYSREFSLEDRNLTGKPYRYAVFAYRVRAVNRLGVAGGPSSLAFTIPAAPQFVFTREQGETCQLKWEAGDTRDGLRYRIYRMDGRWNKDPIPRLNATPQTQTTYTDPGAGTSTRRYYIVAVDALGQEGFPSAPAWHYREWRDYYKPFVGDWHQ